MATNSDETFYRYKGKKYSIANSLIKMMPFGSKRRSDGTWIVSKEAAENFARIGEQTSNSKQHPVPVSEKQSGQSRPGFSRSFDNSRTYYDGKTLESQLDSEKQWDPQEDAIVSDTVIEDLFLWLFPQAKALRSGLSFVKGLTRTDPLKQKGPGTQERVPYPLKSKEPPVQPPTLPPKRGNGDGSDKGDPKPTEYVPVPAPFEITINQPQPKDKIPSDKGGSDDKRRRRSIAHKKEPNPSNSTSVGGVFGEKNPFIALTFEIPLKRR